MSSLDFSTMTPLQIREQFDKLVDAPFDIDQAALTKFCQDFSNALPSRTSLVRMAVKMVEDLFRKSARGAKKCTFGRETAHLPGYQLLRDSAHIVTFHIPNSFYRKLLKLSTENLGHPCAKEAVVAVAGSNFIRAARAMTYARKTIASPFTARGKKRRAIDLAVLLGEQDPGLISKDLLRALEKNDKSRDSAFYWDCTFNTQADNSRFALCEAAHYGLERLQKAVRNSGSRPSPKAA